jgi:hypothetical protein
MSAPNFYKIDCEREVVVQGRSSTFITIARNDQTGSSLSPSEDLVVIAYPQPNTFETHIILPASSYVRLTDPSLAIPADELWFSWTAGNPSGSDNHRPTFSRMSTGLVVKNWYDVVDANTTSIPYLSVADAPLEVFQYDNYGFRLRSQNGATIDTIYLSPAAIELGRYAEEEGGHWEINAADANILLNTFNDQSGAGLFFDASINPLPAPNDRNPFDGDISGPIYQDDSGAFSRISGFWAKVPFDANNQLNNGVTFRIDYDGLVNSHYKINFLISAITSGSTSETEPVNPGGGEQAPVLPYGFKSRVIPPVSFPRADYQEIHLFGYTEDYIRPQRDTVPLPYEIEKPIYDDRSSFGLLKTNPKISGNVKLTVDSTGELWMNSFDANDELSDASYKKFPISSASTYQKDLWSFFKEGQTPSDVIFDLYQVDDQYLNTQRTFDRQFDNFYNYGVEQLRSKFYDESLSFFAPLWLRKTVPDYFVIFRVDHPFNPETYFEGTTNEDKFIEFFKDARIIKTFDLRPTSKVGSYLRKIVNDPRYKERPLEVSWESDVATYWYGAAYQNGTLTGKGEFLYDYYRQDRPIKELEEYITGGFERNGIISTNLINLEFLFDDEEAPLYGINRYFGFYVTENQLAEFEIEPRVLGKIQGQTPPPKPGVDGQPYSTRSFVQTNTNGIQIPVNYYHSTTFTNNTSNIPEYQGLVIGKFPLPQMVDDPLRFFYVKDRNDVFKRVNKLTEVDYGVPGNTQYVRATQLQLFDNQEDMSVYAGVNEIVSQLPAELLSSGNAQLRVHLYDQFGTGVLQDDEEIIFNVKRYNEESRVNRYVLQVSAVTPTSVTVEYFLNQVTDQVQVPFSQPAVGGNVIVTVVDSSRFSVGQGTYIVSGGYYTIVSIPSPTTIEVKNLGGYKNATPLSGIIPGSLIGSALTGEATYTVNPLGLNLSIDNYLTLVMTDFFSGYSVGASWEVDVNYPSIIKTNLPLSPVNNIDAYYIADYQQFSWRLIASPVGLRAGDAWDYPMTDPDGLNYISQFSNEGTPAQVAQALAQCINSFENSPVDAWADKEVVYMRSRILYEDGNDISLTRKLKGNSVYANLGFYETGNASRGETITQQTYAPLSTIDLSVAMTELLDQPSSTGYYLNILRTSTSTTIWGRLGADVSTYATATSTGTVFFFTTPIRLDSYQSTQLPFSIDLRNIPDGVSTEFAYEISGSLEVSQNFVGGVRRIRNRAKISNTDGQMYYSDRRVSRTGATTAGSTTILIDSVGLYVGAPITGEGILENTTIVDVNSGSIVISQPASVTNSTNSLRLGELSILNDSIIYQKWYQAQKGLYSRMKGWNVQGKYVYSLPYLDEPTYNSDEILNGFVELDSAVIQLEDGNQEFYISIDDRIVAYKVYRPVLGIFSLFPIKEFDFDFIFSDYSYTPILEALPYYFEETLGNGDTVELPIFENFELTVVDDNGARIPVTGSYNYDLEIEVYNPDNETWYNVESLNIDYRIAPPDILGLPLGTQNDIIVNTFYPFYDYDELETPFLHVDNTLQATNFLQYYQFKGTGKRNFDKRYLRTFDPVTQQEVIFNPEKFRIRFLPVNPAITPNLLRVRNYNYSNDRDLTLFNGFAGLQDIEGIDDVNQIQTLKDEGKFIEAYTYQLLISEYDRLRENFNKDFAVRSIVVPYINKWVQEGTDARDNYYRLNTSLAFGINNLSPNGDIDFPEPSVLTHEFPYLDAFPKNYLEDSLEFSRSYMYAKLSDTAYDNRTWIDLLSTNDNYDWFTKYFSLGYPTEETYLGVKIPKSREERFTFLSYNNGIGRSQTLFRGGKIEVLDIDPVTGSEVSDSAFYEGYKFSAIARFDKHDLRIKEKPVDIEIIKNEKYKTILLIITVRIDDYRTQHGHIDYMSQYFMIDILKNTNQQQKPLSLGNNASLSLRNFLPYNATYVPFLYEDNQAVLRPRQGFLGGGYLQLSNKKLGGIINYTPADGPIPAFLPAPSLRMFLKTVDPTYLFNLQEEQILTQDLYATDLGNYPFIYDPNTVGIVTQPYTKNGHLFGFFNTYVSGTSIRMQPILNNQITLDTIGPSTVTFGVGSQTTRWNRGPVLPGPLYNTFLSGLFPSLVSPSGTAGLTNFEVSTFSMEGTYQGYQSLKNYLSYANISGLVNSDSLAIEYYVVENGAKVPSTDYKLRFISPDPIIKTNVLHFTEDTDKPQEYLDTALIGFDIVDTNLQEYILRHRGFYEPKTRDVISFWVREDNDFTQHFEKDFLLSNTHLNGKSELSAFVRNYGINKVAAGGEVLKIARGSSYKSLYPLIGEIAVDHSTMFAIDSSWDNNFYRDYVTTTDFVNRPGLVEMKEQKTFLASKAMNVPNSYELHTYNDTEVSFNLVAPAVSIGVPELVTNETVNNQSRPNANKPKLTIRIDLRTRLLRNIVEEINSGTYVDEFSNLLTYSLVMPTPQYLPTLTQTDVDRLKTSYIEKNIIDLYQVTEVNLFVLNREGIDLVNLNLTEAQKTAAGYKIDKDCVVTKITNFVYEITKVLDPKTPSGFAISAKVTRI